MVEVISQMPENVLAFAAHGKVTGADYEQVIIPALEDKLKSHRKIRFLYHLGDDFSGFSPAALWDDAKISLGHLSAFERIAIVSDVPWVTEAMRFFGFLVPCPMRVFKNAQLSEAKAWLS